MEKFTSKDIEAIREYRKKIEDLDKKTPSETVTKEEWEDFFKILDETGEFPSKYKGRIAKKQELTYTVPVNGKPTPCPEGKDRTIYYDIAFEKVNAEYYELQRQYHASIIKALETYFDKKHLGDDNADFTKELKEQPGITEIIAELLEDPEIRKELEKEAKAAQLAELPPLGSMPNGDSLNWLYRVINSSKGGRLVEESNHR